MWRKMKDRRFIIVVKGRIEDMGRIDENKLRKM